MRKAQKIMIVFTIILALMFAYSINVKAATMSNLEEWNVATRDGNIYTLNESEDEIKQDIVVQSGENAFFDLNGQTLTNFTDGCSTITVEGGGTLTIMGTGTITNTSSNNVPTITNNGDLIIVNGNVTSNNTDYATCILNNGYVRITGGTITTTTQNCWGLTNSGTAEIVGGTFKQEGNFSVIMNAGDMTISGGSIEVTSGYSAITNESTDGTSASLKITDVTVTGAKYIISNPEGESVVVTGGNYGTDSNISDYLDESYVVDEDGNVTEAPETTDPVPEEPTEDPDKDASEEPVQGNDDETAEKDETPKTGVVSYLGIAVLATVMSTIAIISLKKKNA